jgi:glycerate kinase
VLDKKNRIVKFGLAGLKHAASINGDDVTRVRDLYSTITFTMVHDTHATLTGKENCINLFAEQKGLGKLGRYFAERTLRKWAALLQGINPSFDPHKAGTGAAGGVTSPFSALFSTKFTNGFDFFSHETGLANSILPSDLLFTGEGRFDRTSRDKKIVMPTIQLAEKHGAECAVIVGSIAESERDFLSQQRAVKKVCVIADHATTVDESISRASEIIVQSFSDQIKELV